MSSSLYTDETPAAVKEAKVSSELRGELRQRYIYIYIHCWLIRDLGFTSDHSKHAEWTESANPSGRIERCLPYGMDDFSDQYFDQRAEEGLVPTTESEWFYFLSLMV
jgi:hypothetical protein